LGAVVSARPLWYRCRSRSDVRSNGALTDFRVAHRLVRPGSRVPMFMSTHGRAIGRGHSTPKRHCAQRARHRRRDFRIFGYRCTAFTFDRQ
jgi:hypothetical protein